MPRRLLYTFLWFERCSHLFLEPITVAEFTQKVDTKEDTARQAFERWRNEGLIFEAGRVRGSVRGAPPMRYCSDSRLAMRLNLMWLFNEHDRKTTG